MTATAIIGCDSPLGKYWQSKRYFDCLINETNDTLLRGHQFGSVVLICPSLWASPSVVQSDLPGLKARIARLIDILAEAKIERLTYVTTLDLMMEDGDEDACLPVDALSEYQGALSELNQYLNLQYGRVLNLRVPELAGFKEEGSRWSVLSELLQCNSKHKPKVGLLTKHQLYPVDRIVTDAEKAWECGLSSVNLVTEPVTVFSIAEKLGPSVVDLLPTAREKDPAGSSRVSKYAIHWNDLAPSYIMNKDEVLECLESVIQSNG